jgi:hypothetical protein
MRAIAGAAFLTMLAWPSTTASEPHLSWSRVSVAGIQLILLVRPHGRIIPAGRPFWKIIQDPLGN